MSMATCATNAKSVSLPESSGRRRVLPDRCRLVSATGWSGRCRLVCSLSNGYQKCRRRCCFPEVAFTFGGLCQKLRGHQPKNSSFRPGNSCGGVHCGHVCHRHCQHLPGIVVLFIQEWPRFSTGIDIASSWSSPCDSLYEGPGGHPVGMYMKPGSSTPVLVPVKYIGVDDITKPSAIIRRYYPFVIHWSCEMMTSFHPPTRRRHFQR